MLLAILLKRRHKNEPEKLRQLISQLGQFAAANEWESGGRGVAGALGGARNHHAAHTQQASLRLTVAAPWDPLKDLLKKAKQTRNYAWAC